ncbi:MAG: molybdopterin molybdenumtransferase MoeA, partial [Actinobacteria bacterium]|nr:molybdopterin molybdenumtransferase MoeA [Actinomycetota bacterium]
MITLTAAQERVWSGVTALDPREVSCETAAGLVLAAVDGFAVRAADVAEVPATLRVIGTLAAGDGTEWHVDAGQALRIMTGAPMPTGADAVVMVEDCEAEGDQVIVRRSVKSGVAVRPVADDVRAGDVVFSAGTLLNAAGAGVLASINARRVSVFPRARVALLSTGDELVTDGSPLVRGQIRERLREAATNHDAIVTSGGVSMGDFDVVKAVLSRIAEMQWMQMAVKPAKPFAFGMLASGHRRVPIFGLPGNPVSSMISFELLARPALRKMMGHTANLLRPSVRAIADAPLRRKPDGKVHFMRVFGHFATDGRLHVRDTGPQGSHQLAAT